MIVWLGLVTNHRFMTSAGERCNLFMPQTSCCCPRQKQYSYFEAFEHTSLIIFHPLLYLDVIHHMLYMKSGHECRFLFFNRQVSLLKSVSSIDAYRHVESRFIFNCTSVTQITSCKQSMKAEFTVQYLEGNIFSVFFYVFHHV